MSMQLIKEFNEYEIELRNESLRSVSYRIKHPRTGKMFVWFKNGVVTNVTYLSR